MPEKIQVILIGLGRIGQSLDDGLDKNSYCLTHASAFSSHPAFEVLGGVDPSSEARKNFESRFNLKSYAEIAELPQNLKIDLAIVASPTSQLASSVKAILVRKPKALLLEKPMGTSFEEAQALARLCKENSVRLFVNFMRRTEPGVLKVRDLLQQKKLGDLQKIVVTYSKGMMNNASHFVDLLRFWLGEPSFHQVIGGLDQNFEGDLEPDFSLRFGNVPAYFLSAREKFYSVRDIEIIGSEAALHYLRGGQKIYLYRVVESNVFRSYKFLSLEPEEIPSDLNRVQYFVADEIAKHFHSSSDLSSQAFTLDADSALRTIENLERIRSLCQVH